MRKQVCKNPDAINYSSCETGNPPSLTWQVYNTAPTPSGVTCLLFNASQQPEEITIEIECYSKEVFYTVVDKEDRLENVDLPYSF